ncbi:hypothetical protein [Symbiopectobacterium purcellii]|uniref:Secreted effector protein PipB2 N-terminal domain-containing protein n=1 Tax=Symbiopectobacterium purcellii TaxID=2871826 RepID=A0ABX9AY12_9ENTR|nr:hypothetical protein [Symbiopectobacterium purcellii]QZN97835.1 hypothetical protein K6K13_11345 [Symbiopectobacterium purcellii]
MNNSMHITSDTNNVAQYIQNHVTGNVAPTPSCLNSFLEKIIDIITFGFLKKGKDDDYKKFTTDFTSNLLHEIQKKHNRNNSYYIPHCIEFEYLNNSIIFESNDKNTKEKSMTTLIVATPQGETYCKTIDTETFSQFCKIQLAIERDLLTEDEISFTPEGKPDSGKMDAATESLLSYILVDVDSLENTLRNDAPKPAQPSSTEYSIPLNENCHPAQSNVLQQNTSFLYRQLSRQTAHDDSTINQKDNSIKKTSYTQKQKYLEETISNIVEKLKLSYTKDSDQRRNTECDGLFRISGSKIENDTALIELDKRSLDIDKTHRDTLVYVLKQSFSNVNPITEKILLQMMKKPNEAAEILYKRIDTMEPKAKKLFLIILGFYSDAYQSADDSKTSMFNKTQLLAAALRLTILPKLYDCTKETPMDLSFIKERNNDGDRIVASLLTSFSYANGSVQLKTNHQECANAM